MSLEMGTHSFLAFDIPEADLTANTAQEFVAPVAGYITSLRTTVQKAVTTGGTLTLKTGASVGTTVAGGQATIANGAVVGSRTVNTTTPNDGSVFVIAGARIQIALAGFATAGRVRGTIGFNSAGNNG